MKFMENIRAVDEFRKIVLPIDVREKLNIKENDELDVSIEIKLQKHNSDFKSEFGSVIVDELGRIEISEEVAKLLGIKAKNFVEISIDESDIILKKCVGKI